jgi:hypothetical protein
MLLEVQLVDVPEIKRKAVRENHVPGAGQPGVLLAFHRDSGAAVAAHFVDCHT